jgi:molybdopterin converting factor small subunit
MIAIEIPSTLRDYCGLQNELSVSAATVRDAIGELQREYPSLYNSICDETGVVRQHINFFVNTQVVSVRRIAQMDIPLHSGDVLTIWTAVSGG